MLIPMESSDIILGDQTTQEDEPDRSMCGSVNIQEQQIILCQSPSLHLCQTSEDHSPSNEEDQRFMCRQVNDSPSEVSIQFSHGASGCATKANTELEESISNHLVPEDDSQSIALEDPVSERERRNSIDETTLTKHQKEGPINEHASLQPVSTISVISNSWT